VGAFLILMKKSGQPVVIFVGVWLNLIEFGIVENNFCKG
jgi:hypothetical protein